MMATPTFGHEVKRSFQVHAHCYDCVEFYSGCPGWRASREFACRDYYQLHAVLPGSCGQVFPPSWMKGRREPRELANTNAPSGSRHCECGETLAKGKRLCDECRTERRKATFRTAQTKHRRAASIEAV